MTTHKTDKPGIATNVENTKKLINPEEAADNSGALPGNVAVQLPGVVVYVAGKVGRNDKAGNKHADAKTLKMFDESKAMEKQFIRHSNNGGVINSMIALGMAGAVALQSRTGENQLKRIRGNHSTGGLKDQTEQTLCGITEKDAVILGGEAGSQAWKMMQLIYQQVALENA